MWNEPQRAAMARISESDRQTAAQTARRGVDKRYQAMLDAGNEDGSDWEYAALIGLGLFLWRGRQTPVAVARVQLDRVLAGLEGEARALSGNRNATGWALGMVGVVKSTALIGAAFAVGGWAQLAGPVVAEVETAVLSELNYLDGFADDVAAGRVPRDGRFVRRAMLYAAAGWGLYQALRGRAAGWRGYHEEHNVLNPGAEHCAGCVSETDRGWQPIATLLPIGDRQCRGRCRCHLEYRNRAGETAA